MVTVSCNNVLWEVYRCVGAGRCSHWAIPPVKHEPYIKTHCLWQLTGQNTLLKMVHENVVLPPSMTTRGSNETLKRSTSSQLQLHFPAAPAAR